VVSFTINSGGRVVGVSLAKRTGHPILDREAVAMVRRASPFPAIPPGTGKSQVTVRAPIRFDMR
jgi:protein TonB